MNEPLIAKIMSQAQAFASAWALVGSPFGDDDQIAKGKRQINFFKFLWLVPKFDRSSPGEVLCQNRVV